MTVFTAILAVFGLLNAQAQNNAEQPQEVKKKTVYLLPDGKELQPGGMDSLKKVWGSDRIMFQHDETDDERGIMHLVQLTDEMKKQMEEDSEKSKARLRAMIGHPSPDFNLKDINGKNWDLKALKGKVVVLNFWFTSCPPCIQEMPELNATADYFKDRKTVFLGLTFNKESMIRSFLVQHEFKYNLVAESQETNQLFYIDSWPTSIIIDENGIVRHVFNYSQTIGEDLKQAIKALQ